MSFEGNMFYTKRVIVSIEYSSSTRQSIGASFYIGSLSADSSPLLIPDQDTELFRYQVVQGGVASQIFRLNRRFQQSNPGQIALNKEVMVHVDDALALQAKEISANIRRLVRIIKESKQESSQDLSPLTQSINLFEFHAREHEKLFLALAYHVVRNYQIAQDIVQDSLERAYKTLQTYSEDRLRTLKMKAWLCRIVANTALNYKKRDQKLVPLDLYDDWLLQKEGYRFEPPEIALLKKEIEALLRLTLGTLPKQQKDIVILRFWHGYKLEEIATKLRRPIGTIKCYLNRALSLMREILRLSGVSVKDVNILSECDLDFLL